ncbi:hypothetical protein WT92_21970 [Burkholderia stagnalis]|uniref:Uncharacterized protein n=1 Tax=Burkholderia stagnalis TaxID=1503054 RepID=A0A125JEZ5_9BURK|nr:hypothetical protein WT35_00335 [Burkholderia stagnalis]KWA50117.1 hypothetical protein WT42_19935 [Burkholderia stagnalis]KWA52785.1 hypothetical protein WT43_25605 [Burkholderia stagnalis]KWA54609.1 hypothetical protein WT44_28765 [Burkholderia stagnalis]KWC92509.1 hypothetical protein WT45_28950 [Burkholderia stagnalis]
MAVRVGIKLFRDSSRFIRAVLERTVGEPCTRSDIERGLTEAGGTATRIQFIRLDECLFERTAGANTQVDVIDGRPLAEQLQLGSSA